MGRRASHFAKIQNISGNIRFFFVTSRVMRNETEIQFLPGVGPKRAEALMSEFGVRYASDLLRVYPFRYIDRTSFVRIADVRGDAAFIQILAYVRKITLFGAKGEIPQENPKELKFNTVKRMSVWVGDGSGEMEMTFFRGIKWMFGKLSEGGTFIFFGRPSEFNGRFSIVHPEVDRPEKQTEADAHQGGILPIGDTTDAKTPWNRTKGRLVGVYPSGEKLKNCGITGKVMNRIMQGALNAALGQEEETLPIYILEKYGLAPIHYALRNIHFPDSAEALERSRFRLKFEELFFLQLALLKQKFIRSRAEDGILIPKVGEAFNKCYEALPFPLTGAQKRVITEIRDDMKSGHQMNRLLQGDVGSGKTMVAVLSALIAVGNGYQACIMAPTEVLAQQHYRNICKYLAPTGVRAALLTGSSRTAERREVHAGLEDGSIGIVVGTHALIEDSVKFRRFGLAIVDEQHRFGVEQRAKLWRKTCDGKPPHVLVMTATPIPRTLAMTLYGDLDVSVINELPPGRKPVQTIHGTEGKRPMMYNFLKKEIAAGRQVFIVYPLIFESEKLDYQNLENGIETIRHYFPFPPYKIAVVHGKLDNEEKAFNMDAFSAGRANILVATSVIEVGVDVPNASVMVIESAERFGLSQLHQLRGRVGRGSDKAYCILMTGHKLSKESKNRIELMCRTENGFEIAEEDMKMRGPGDLEGTQQSGLPISLNIASLARDGQILGAARNAAAAVLNEDPALSLAKNAPLLAELRKNKYEIKDYSKIS